MSTNTIDYILRSGTDYLTTRNVECPQSILEILLCRLLACKPLELTTRREEMLPDKYLDALRRGLKRAGEHQPVQHIVGEVNFMGHVLKSDPRALIPRPETEQLVDLALKNEALWTDPSPRVIDFGTGSGCIAIAIAKARPDAKILAIDISDDALALARENAAKHEVADQISFTNQELSELVEPESIDLVISNPPYIPSADCDALPDVVRNHDPRTALDGGPNGLVIVASLVMDASFVLKNGGALYLEMGAKQGTQVRALFEETGFGNVTVAPDLTGRDRFVHGTLSMA
jgi:release factor glutamine methyltransferase